MTTLDLVEKEVEKDGRAQSRTETTKKDKFTPTVLNIADDPRNLSVTTVATLPENPDDEVVEKRKKDETPSDEKKTEKAEKQGEEAAAPKTEKKGEEEEPEKPKESLKEEKEHDPIWYTKRIGELTKKRKIEKNELENELAFERKRRLDIEAELSKVKSAIPSANRPKEEDFATNEEYTDAILDWKLESKMNVQREKDAKVATERAEREALDAEIDSIEELIAKGNKKYPKDFGDLTSSEDFINSEPMIKAIRASKIGEDILYYLAKHPDVSAEIAEMDDPDAVAVEIGVIKAKLLAPPPKKITNAPEPITPIKTGSAIKTGEYREGMSMKEFKAWWDETHKK